MTLVSTLQLYTCSIYCIMRRLYAVYYMARQGNELSYCVSIFLSSTLRQVQLECNENISSHCVRIRPCRSMPGPMLWKAGRRLPVVGQPRPYYYHCQKGFLSYRTCHPNEVFNAWTRRCGESISRLLEFLQVIYVLRGVVVVVVVNNNI